MVGGNSLNHLKDFYKGIRIRALFSKGNVGLVCGMWGRGIKKGGGGDSLETFGRWRSVEEKNGERSM